MVAIVKGNTGDWEIIIGLEMHAQVISNAKLFSGASTDFGAEPNTQVSFVDAGFPGMLPVLNEKCVEQAVKTGLGINARINLRSVFDRKNYFYPDLPTGYQISQFYHPIVENGKVYLDMPDGVVKEVGVTRIHLEQDAGKSLHDQSPNETFIDLNRAGVALMEIVSEPDLRSSEEAGEYVRKLRSIVRYLGTCDGDMEKGSLRCDANVSVRRVGETKLNTRVEIKNINSIRNIMRAIDYEAARQVSAMESGETIVQETRLFDAGMGETRTMRSKEEAHDYRYFADPDLLPLVLTEQYVDSIRKSLPELPDQKIRRYTKEMGLSHYDASVLVSERSVAEYFEEVAQNSDAKVAANWITGELFGRLNKDGLSMEENPISAAQLSELLALIHNGTISGKIAKSVFDTMFANGGSAKEIVESQGLMQVSDNSAIEKIVDDVLAQNPDKVVEYKSGKDKLFGFFVGQVMKLSQGKANPALVNDVLKAKLQ
ncbi:MAG: aspartyl/glutamyl-tRNA amidotransferase subunit [Candidatus Midichloriaceae bacterium]|jgi:aspartyl-tRNA(Asn)/glutamyl-tRNA(Gln) amidotransferase subunit B|nr:aspartyl/glutamyl-tRNA amidotransferase subunit [Candidatus Midichloriaceae bacterium]